MNQPTQELDDAMRYIPNAGILSLLAILEVNTFGIATLKYCTTARYFYCASPESALADEITYAFQPMMLQ